MPRMHPQLRPMMQAPPPTGTTGKAPPGVGRLGAGVGAGAALAEALVAVAAGAGARGCAAPTAGAHPTIKTESPTIQLNCTRISITRYRLGCWGRSRGDTLRLSISGSGLAVRATAGASQTTDAPTVEPDNAATRLRQRGKPGGNHTQRPAASKTAGSPWRRRYFPGHSARRRCSRCRCACPRTDRRTAADH